MSIVVGIILFVVGLFLIAFKGYAPKPIDILMVVCGIILAAIGLIMAVVGATAYMPYLP